MKEEGTKTAQARLRRLNTLGGMDGLEGERNARTFRGETLSAIELALAIKEQPSFQWGQSGYKSFKTLPPAWR